MVSGSTIAFGLFAIYASLASAVWAGVSEVEKIPATTSFRIDENSTGYVSLPSNWDNHIDVEITGVAQFIGVCRRSKWSKHVTNSPLLAFLAMAGSSAARKISSACSKAFC